MKTRTAGTAAAECDQRTKRWRATVSQSNRSHARTFPDGRRLHGASPPAENFAGLILPCEDFFHLETAAKLLKFLERVLAVFSKCALKLLGNQADFDSAIPRFESWRPSQPVSDGHVRLVKKGPTFRGLVRCGAAHEMRICQFSATPAGFRAPVSGRQIPISVLF
jgi:hypothetical protein